MNHRSRNPHRPSTRPAGSETNPTTIDAVVRLLKNCDVIFFGSVADVAHGVDRAPNDVDVIYNPHNLADLFETLRPHMTDYQRDQVAKGESVKLSVDGTYLDLVGTRFPGESFSEVLPDTVERIYKGSLIRVPDLEALINMRGRVDRRPTRMQDHRTIAKLRDLQMSWPYKHWSDWPEPWVQASAECFAWIEQVTDLYLASPPYNVTVPERRIWKTILVGSYAMGSATITSDADVVVAAYPGRLYNNLDEKNGEFAAYSHIITEATEKMYNRCQELGMAPPRRPIQIFFKHLETTGAQRVVDFSEIYHESQERAVRQILGVDLATGREYATVADLRTEMANAYAELYPE